MTAPTITDTPDAETGGPEVAPAGQYPDGTQWAGPLCELGKPVPGGFGQRVLAPPAADGTGMVIRPLPLPLSFQFESSHGGEEAGKTVITGRITGTRVEGNMLIGWGDYLDPGDNWQSADAIQSAAQRVVNGLGMVSVDTAPTVIEYAVQGEDGTLTPVDPALYDGDGDDVVAVFAEWELMGATLVADPAFGTARIAPVDGAVMPGGDDGAVMPPAMPDSAPGAFTADGATAQEPTVTAEQIEFPDGTVVKVGDEVTVVGDSGASTGVVASIDPDAQTVTLTVGTGDNATTVTVDVDQLVSSTDDTPADEPSSQTAAGIMATCVRTAASVLATTDADAVSRATASDWLQAASKSFTASGAGSLFPVVVFDPGKRSSAASIDESVTASTTASSTPSDEATTPQHTPSSSRATATRPNDGARANAASSPDGQRTGDEPTPVTGSPLTKRCAYLLTHKAIDVASAAIASSSTPAKALSATRTSMSTTLSRASSEGGSVAPVTGASDASATGRKLSALPSTGSNLAASGETYRYPAEWFEPVALEGPTGLTVTDEGRVYGHLALANSCHTAFDQCVTPPSSAAGYAYFHLGEVDTTAGPLAVGKLTVGGGHADPKTGWRGTVEHYDNAGATAAVVRAHEDEHGIQVTGGIVPTATDTQVAALRRSPLSGDWRRIGGNLELVAALSVNVPGFPVPRLAPRAALAASGVQTSLVAAGIVQAPSGGGEPETTGAVTLPSGVQLTSVDVAVLASAFDKVASDRTSRLIRGQALAERLRAERDAGLRARLGL